LDLSLAQFYLKFFIQLHIIPLNSGGYISHLKEICTKTGMKLEGIYSISMSGKSKEANVVVVGLGNTIFDI
jgi:hypothetical protein